MAPLTLTTPSPRLQPPGTPASLEMPLTVELEAMKYPDGTPVASGEAAKSGVFVYRTAVAGGAEEIWNDGDQFWQLPPADLSALQPTPFQYKNGASRPWQALVIAAGLKDRAGADRFAKAVGGYPIYRARAYAEARRGSATFAGTSSVSVDWTFVRDADKARGGITFDSPTTQAKDATRATQFIRSPGLALAAFIEVRATSGNEVQIARCDAGGTVVASVVIAGNGDIELHPAPGRRVVIAGDLHCERINYLASPSGPRRDLT